MPDRLSALDVSFLYLEEPTTPLHVGSVALFDDGDLDYETLLTLVRERLAFVPRYRQRVRWVPAHLANPVWVDDDDFDLTYHVRRSALPKPGTPDQLRELVARLMSRPLDRTRPLWEMYLVEGLAGGKFALVSKTHQAVVDGISTVDIGQVVLDPSPEPPPAPSDVWSPVAEPSALELVVGAVSEAVRRPSAMLDTARSTLSDVTFTTGRVVDVLGEAAGGLARALRLARPAPGSPLNVPIGAQRRFATVDTRLDAYRDVRAQFGGSVNDVVLATIAGALRSWLFTRGIPVRGATTVRALVPMRIQDGESDTPRGVGSRVAEYVVDLPIGEPSPAMRLHQVSYAMKAHSETGQAVGARAMTGMAGFAPPTMHALGARVASSLSRRTFNLVVTNVPGPQNPLYAAGAAMQASYPYVPLAKGQALAIGLTSYNGSVYFGLNADRDAMADLDVLAEAIPDALRELLDSVDEPRRKRNVRRRPAARTDAKAATRNAGKRKQAP
ncbi:WS/DGAT/MGAT family O-acyltransferase [Flindersiella endophytica]